MMLTRNLLLWGLHGILIFSLCSCSWFRRSETAESAVVDATEEPEQQDLNMKYLESEISKLNSKIESMETKLSILTNTVQNFQAKASQPAIIAEPEHVTSETVEQEPISSQKNLPVIDNSNVENAFVNAMNIFQQQKYLEATTFFSALTREYPQHVLASHALYWAGEASRREQRWALAQKHWEELIARYPQSIYYSDALAGLSASYAEQKNQEKAENYKQSLLRLYPSSPAAMRVLAQEDVSQGVRKE